MKLFLTFILNNGENMNEQFNQYLTFFLNEDIFAINITSVKEVIEFNEITKVPNLPDYVQGVINLRGNVVPVWDLKEKFVLPKSEKTVDTCVIILEKQWNDENVIFGVLADSVREVIELDDGDIEPPPKLGNKISVKYSLGMGNIQNHYCTILNVDKILSESDMNNK